LPGTYVVSLVATDDDTGASTPATATIVVSGVGIVPDPLDPTKTALLIVGTNGNDTIHLIKQGSGGDVKVQNNGAQATFHPTGHIIVHGLAGNDSIDATGSVGLPLIFFGEAGNDSLGGGSGNAILVGGDGNDCVQGGTGRGLLIGGTGADNVAGNPGDDILIGGFTTYDTNITALNTVETEWARGDRTFSQRVQSITQTGLPGGIILNNTTVFDDAVGDILTGASGNNLFFYKNSGPNKDTIKDLKGGDATVLL
jgi:Ca2+-binding RTX toxin-like protein